jgi:4-carboxymuconolactone decarboxylase
MRDLSWRLHSQRASYMVFLAARSGINQRRRQDMKRLVVLALCAAIAISLVVIAQEVSVYSAEKQERFPLLQVDKLSDQQRPFADQILKVSSIGLSGPYNMLLRSPVMGQRVFSLLDYLRFNTSVPRRLNEFAILIQARLWTSQIEWTAHYPLALKAGLTQSVADDLKVGKRPADMKPDEAAVYDLCMEISKNHFVSDATFQKAREQFSDQQIVDLLSVSGTYTMLARLSNPAEDKTPGGKTPPLQPLTEK